MNPVLPVKSLRMQSLYLPLIILAYSVLLDLKYKLLNLLVAISVILIDMAPPIFNVSFQSIDTFINGLHCGGSREGEGVYLNIPYSL